MCFLSVAVLKWPQILYHECPLRGGVYVPSLESRWALGPRDQGEGGGGAGCELVGLGFERLAIRREPDSMLGGSPSSPRTGPCAEKPRPPANTQGCPPAVWETTLGTAQSDPIKQLDGTPAADAWSLPAAPPRGLPSPLRLLKQKTAIFRRARTKFRVVLRRQSITTPSEQQRGNLLTAILMTDVYETLTATKEGNKQIHYV